MELVLKSLDLLLSKILLPGTDPQAFRRRFQGQCYEHQILIFNQNKVLLSETPTV